MSLTKQYVRDGRRRIIGSVTSGFSDTSAVVRDEDNEIVGRTSQRFHTTRDDHGTLVSINSPDPGLLIGRKPFAVSHENGSTSSVGPSNGFPTQAVACVGAHTCKRRICGDRARRWHFIAHSIGGGLDANPFSQERCLNRGWSPQGKIYRQMETYCYEQPGTFCFSRPSLYRWFKHSPVAGVWPSEGGSDPLGRGI